MYHRTEVSTVRELSHKHPAISVFLSRPFIVSRLILYVRAYFVYFLPFYSMKYGKHCSASEISIVPVTKYRFYSCWRPHCFVEAHCFIATLRMMCPPWKCIHIVLYSMASPRLLQSAFLPSYLPACSLLTQRSSHPCRQRNRTYFFVEYLCYGIAEMPKTCVYDSTS